MLEKQSVLCQRLKNYIDVINFNLEAEEAIEKFTENIALYPMTEQSLVELSLEARMAIDSLIYRFLIIQDYASSKLFPLISQIITGNLQQLSWFDTLALMEKHGVITSEVEWDALRKLRNLLSHEYEKIPSLRAMDVNRLFEALPILYKQIQLINRYVEKICD